MIVVFDLYSGPNKRNTIVCLNPLHVCNMNLLDMCGNEFFFLISSKL